MYPIAKSDRTPLIDEKTYLAMYQESIENSDVFWSKKAKEFLDWDKDWDSTSNVDYHQGLIEWFKGGKLNVAYNCIDRHLPQRANQTAIIWEGDNPEVSQKVTYQQLHDEVATLANGLKKLGVRKGDRVCIYMPMILQASYAMLACARIGAIHSVVFGGFSPEALKDRILDSECKIVITADEGMRGGRSTPLKTNVDIAVAACDCVESVIVVQNTKGDVAWGNKDVWYHDLVEDMSKECPCESFDAETPYLFSTLQVQQANLRAYCIPQAVICCMLP
ncbi:Acetyl-coenzyme A synthetase (EC [uncultured Gammaproteobacteria bacterium]|nr:Acetyl-coenzyme A synthetase (EC [uncultured Gammaproteobacteria bacterium]